MYTLHVVHNVPHADHCPSQQRCKHRVLELANKSSLHAICTAISIANNTPVGVQCPLQVLSAFLHDVLCSLDALPAKQQLQLILQGSAAANIPCSALPSPADASAPHLNSRMASLRSAISTRVRCSSVARACTSRELESHESYSAKVSLDCTSSLYPVVCQQEVKQDALNYQPILLYSSVIPHRLYGPGGCQAISPIMSKGFE